MRFSQAQQSAPDRAVPSSASLITSFPKQLTWRVVANWMTLWSWCVLPGTKPTISPILRHLGRKRRRCYPTGGSEFSLGRAESLKEFGLSRQRMLCSKRTREKCNTLPLGTTSTSTAARSRAATAAPWQGANTCQRVLGLMDTHN